MLTMRRHFLIVSIMWQSFLFSSQMTPQNQLGIIVEREDEGNTRTSGIIKLRDPASAAKLFWIAEACHNQASELKVGGEQNPLFKMAHELYAHVAHADSPCSWLARMRQGQMLCFGQGMPLHICKEHGEKLLRAVAQSSPDKKAKMLAHAYLATQEMIEKGSGIRNALLSAGPTIVMCSNSKSSEALTIAQGAQIVQRMRRCQNLFDLPELMNRLEKLKAQTISPTAQILLNNFLYQAELLKRILMHDVFQHFGKCGVVLEPVEEKYEEFHSRMHTDIGRKVSSAVRDSSLQNDIMEAYQNSIKKSDHLLYELCLQNTVPLLQNMAICMQYSEIIEREHMPKCLNFLFEIDQLASPELRFRLAQIFLNSVLPYEKTILESQYSWLLNRVLNNIRTIFTNDEIDIRKRITGLALLANNYLAFGTTKDKNPFSSYLITVLDDLLAVQDEDLIEKYASSLRYTFATMALQRSELHGLAAGGIANGLQFLRDYWQKNNL